MIDLLYFKWTEPVINDLPNHLLKKKQYFNHRLANKMYEKRFKQQEYTGDHSQIFLSNRVSKWSRSTCVFIISLQPTSSCCILSLFWRYCITVVQINHLTPFKYVTERFWKTIAQFPSYDSWNYTTLKFLQQT